MPADYVLDASAVARLLIEHDDTQAFATWLTARKAEGSRLFASDLLPHELASVLHRERDDRLARDDADFLTGMVAQAMEGIALDDTAWDRTWRWAALLSPYDASYLGVAIAKGATLVTYDRKLTTVAKQHVPVLGFRGLK